MKEDLFGDAGGCGREAGRYGERYDPFLHLSRGHYYTARPCSRYVRHLPSLLTITCHFVSLLTVSSAHTKTKKPKSVNLCSAQLISAHLRRAHGQKTNKKTGPGSTSVSGKASIICQVTQTQLDLLNYPVADHWGNKEVVSMATCTDIPTSPTCYPPCHQDPLFYPLKFHVQILAVQTVCFILFYTLYATGLIPTCIHTAVCGIIYSKIIINRSQLNRSQPY